LGEASQRFALLALGHWRNPLWVWKKLDSGDNAWDAAESPASSACFVGWRGLA